jgi:amino acid transporter
MKKLDSILLKIFLYGLPVVTVCAIFSYSYSPEFIKPATGYAKLLYNLAGLVLALWMMLSLFLSVRLLVSGSFRDKVLAKLTFIRERDEREVILTGKATKTTFLTSLAILIFLFFLSCFHVSIYRVSPEKAVDGKTGAISLGLGFSLLESSKQAKPDDATQKKDLFSYTGLPISSTTVILALIIWQIISYNCSMRRLTRGIEGDMLKCRRTKFP